MAVLPDGRVVTGARRRRRAGAGVGPGRAGRRPGRARPPRGRGGGGGGAAGRAGGHRRATATGGCWCGTRREPGAGPVELGRHELAGWRRWRCCRTGGWSPAAAPTASGCWCGTRPTRAAGPVELGRHEGGVEAVAVLPDGRVVTGGRHDGPGAGVGPGGAGRRPGRARPPRGRGGGGGGAAGRAGGHRRRRRPGAAVGCAEQPTRHSARMLRVRARYFPLPIWSSPLHRSRRGRNFMLGGTRSDTNTPGARQRARNAMHRQTELLKVRVE